MKYFRDSYFELYDKWQLWWFIIFQNELVPLKINEALNLDTYSSCLIRGLSHKAKQIKYDSQTKQHWSTRMIPEILNAYINNYCTAGNVKQTIHMFTKYSNPTPNLCTSGWQNFIRVFTSLLRAVKKNNLVINHLVSIGK